MSYTDTLPELLNANLSEGVELVEVEEQRAVDFTELEGPDRKLERAAFAEALSGTSDKKSKAYKAARRNMERWIKGRVPMTYSVRRIVMARRQSNERLSAFRMHGGECRLQVSWYESRKPEWLPPQRWVHLRQQVMRGIVREWAAGELRAAADVLFWEFLEQYKVPNPEDWARDVVVIDLRLVPTVR